MKRRWVVLAALVLAMGSGALTASAVSPAIAVAAVATRITAQMPTTVEAGRLLTVVGVVTPATPGEQVQLLELRELRGRWEWPAVAASAQDSKGNFLLRIRAGLRGRNTYRVIAQTPRAGEVTSVPAVVTTVGASTPDIRVTRLAHTTPLWAGVGQSSDGPLYATGSHLINGRRYPDSVRAQSYRLRYELGADASTFGAAIALAPTRRGSVLHKGPRLVEIKVDHVVRVRKFLRDGQAFPVRLDVRGKRFVDILSNGSGTRADGAGPGSDLLLGTPVVTSQVLSEKGVDPGTTLDNVKMVGRPGLGYYFVDGEPGRELFGASLHHHGPQTGSTAGSISYDLGGAYTRLTGLPGIFGETSADLAGRVRLFGDGRLLGDLPARLWSYDRSSVDVTGVRRLRIELVATVSGGLSHSYLWYVVWGDGRLT